MANIQWFPGHMQKARREVAERIKQVDIVLEVVDARVPESSRNPMLLEMLQQKPRISILNKADLADPKRTKLWLDEYANGEQSALAIDAQHARQLQQIPQMAERMLAEKLDRKRAKGIRNPHVRAMCIGIPNVGKSTILNRLVRKNIAVTGNRPGVTKNQQWLKTSGNLELLDTPGILWPKFDDQIIGKRLALTGAIADSVFTDDEVALWGLEYFQANYPERLVKHYHLTDEELVMAPSDLMIRLTEKFTYGTEYDRAANRFINDVRKGELGRYTLEVPGDKVSE
ncbi:ribosome biogenesis GTPase YlqF [Lacticaseibacillus zhaodongensis]|uniref:ribosome biogenesis GTPase YlqF n=1 Tax=Lacticaseibacillus zhaodongensis TaxID=2668065 RepID=UPI0012D345F5|nr:ribosome biogenesis GTPase YlqF [Lacticaseibacillus zhaodongensis]